MKFSVLALTMFIINFLSAQNIDSVTIKKIDSIFKESRSLETSKKFDQALEVTNSAERLILEKLGNLSPWYRKSCSIKGRIYYQKMSYTEAERWYLEAKRLCDIINPEYAGIIVNLGLLYSDLNDFEKAEREYLYAKAIFEDSLKNRKHNYYYNCLSNLAREYIRFAKFDKAEIVNLELILILKKEAGVNKTYPFALNSLGNLYANMCRYNEAEKLFLEAIAILEDIVLKVDLQVLIPMNSLAIMYWELGKFDKAEPIYLKGIEILEKTGKTESSMYGKYLGDLATLYLDNGYISKAEAMLVKALEIKEKTLGKESSSYAQSLNNLANLYIGSGNLEKAKKMHQTALDIRSKGDGSMKADYAESLQNLGQMYMEEKDYTTAERMFVKVSQILESTLGKEHPSFATLQYLLANLYFNKGQYNKVEPLMLNAIRICTKTSGKQNNNYSLYINFLADFYRVMNKRNFAIPLYLELHQINKIRVKKCANYSSENQLHAFINKTFDRDNCLHSATQAYPIPELCGASFDDALFFHGYLLDNVQLLINSIAKTDSITRAEFYHWQACNRYLASEYSKIVSERKNVLEIESQAENLEKNLTRKISIFRDAQQTIRWQDIRQKLMPNSVAIQFVHYGYYSPSSTDSTMYAALILRPEWDSPRFVTLFEEKQLDSILLRNAERNEQYVKKLYSLNTRGAIANEISRNTIYELLWKPIKDDLIGVETIFFSSTGLLHQLNIAAIPVSPDSTLADCYNLVELHAMRNILNLSSLPLSVNDGEAILFGGIHYEIDSIEHVVSNISKNNEIITYRSDLDFDQTDSTLRGGIWNFLPGTEKEVNAIEKIMLANGVQNKLEKGYQATEESFKNIGTNNTASPRILHIATHGYFFPDPKSTAKKSSLNGEHESVFKISDHPMLRSGLIMAGGNAAWQGKQSLEGREDGILTAYEISQMNLSNTELVVLSACETGLGDIQGNEGVYGLQRAFKIAGAKYLIMSLWQVPDKQTSLLMTTFYKKWLEAKMNIPNAFHAAQKELRDNGLDPYQWAGFVLVE